MLTALIKTYLEKLLLIFDFLCVLCVLRG